ncbi:MAG: prepilin-type N-terminal cleavage/methylation domain-containing protein [Candidatus Eisenbacteria bacterium]|nr:prepilin-type N-terminal cleavage/methylation domain-containing protein [Candidatus Eisenbacteria bacterium]
MQGDDGVELRQAGQNGFSLIELVVAVVVFSIAIVFVYQMLFSGETTVAFEGERRIALRMAELKIEELKYAGYASTGVDSDWTSVDMTVGTHPDDPTVVLDDRGTDTTTDDLLGDLQWAVRDTSWSGGGVTVDAKLVVVTLDFPKDWNRDQVRLVTVVGE